MDKLGVTAHMSPYWMVVDEGQAQFYRPYLGERADETYPQKSMIMAGVNVTFASDFITSEPNVMLGIYNGMERKNIGEPMLKPASERVDLEEMLEAVTINGAKANFLEGEIGTLEVGKKADIVVLSENLFEIPVQSIPDVKIETTYFEGQVMYQNNDDV